MKKLNNKGMTIIEILICFAMVAVITTSLYSMVSSFNSKKNEEAVKEEIYRFKNLLTKEIYDDIIKKGLINVSNYAGGQPRYGNPKDLFGVTSCNVYYPESKSCNTGTGTAMNNGARPGATTRLALLKFSFADGTNKVLQIASLKNAPTVTTTSTGKYIETYGQFDEMYYVSYGEDGNEIRYPIPNVGESKTPDNLFKIYDLTMTINQLKVEKNILYLEMRFYHPVLADKYSVNIIAPINMDKYDRS